MPEWLIEAIKFLVAILPLLPPRRFRLSRKARRRPIVVYTDAMYEPGKPGAIGIVIYDPHDQEAPWRYAAADVPEWIKSRLQPKETYIGVYEVIAAVAAYSSRPSQFAGRDVLHFITAFLDPPQTDNSGCGLLYP